LFEQNQKIRVVSYQVFRYFSVRLTEIETIDVGVPAHGEILSDHILFVVGYVIEHEYRERKRLAGRQDIAIVRKCAIAAHTALSCLQDVLKTSNRICGRLDMNLKDGVKPAARHLMSQNSMS